MKKVFKISILAIYICMLCSCGYKSGGSSNNDMQERVKELVKTIDKIDYSETTINKNEIGIDTRSSKDREFSSMLNSLSSSKSKITTLLELTGTVGDIIQHSNKIGYITNRNFDKIYDIYGSVIVEAKYSDKFKVVDGTIVDFSNKGIVIYNSELKEIFSYKGNVHDVKYLSGRWYILYSKSDSTYVKCLDSHGKNVWETETKRSKSIRVSKEFVVLGGRYLYSSEGEFIRKSNGKYLLTRNNLFELDRGVLYLHNKGKKRKIGVRNITDTVVCDHACIVVTDNTVNIIKDNSVYKSVHGHVVDVYEFTDYCVIYTGNEYVYLGSKVVGVLNGIFNQSLSTDDYLAYEHDGKTSIKCVKTGRSVSGDINTFRVYKNYCTFSTKNKTIKTDRELNILSRFNNACVFIYSDNIILQYTGSDSRYNITNLKNKKNVNLIVLGVVSDIIDECIIVQNGSSTDIYKIRR